MCPSSAAVQGCLPNRAKTAELLGHDHPAASAWIALLATTRESVRLDPAHGGIDPRAGNSIAPQCVSGVMKREALGIMSNRFVGVSILAVATLAAVGSCRTAPSTGQATDETVASPAPPSPPPLPEPDESLIAEGTLPRRLALERSSSMQSLSPGLGFFPPGQHRFPAQRLRSRDRFASTQPNPVRVTAEEPVSTFSVDVDTASYSFVRNSLVNGVLPPTDAVRVEELVNYLSLLQN